MSELEFQVRTQLGPDAVMAALTDFTARRAEIWPNIDADHFVVHSQGPGWAEVTEGSSVAGGVWERSRYEWDVAAHRLAVVTQDSNAWAPGSRWDYRLTPTPGGGTDVHVRTVRIGRGFKGRLIGVVIALTGRSRLRSDMEKVLSRLAVGETG
jgi:hypothetical protein